MAEKMDIAAAMAALVKQEGAKRSPYGYARVVLADDAASKAKAEAKAAKAAEEAADKSQKHNSLYILTPANPLRKLFKIIGDSWQFDAFIISVILFNCVLLAFQTPYKQEQWADFFDLTEWIFTIIFTVEMVIKIGAYGFILHEGAYLRSAWNWLDFLVVVFGYLALIPGVGNYSAIRTFRVFRALRALTAIEGLRNVVVSLLMSIPPLINVGILSLFFFVLCAIIGIQFFKGVLQMRCVDDVTGEIVDEDEGVCSKSTLSWGYCDDGFTCEEGQGPNPFGGLIGFDNAYIAMLTVLQVVTLDEWEGTLHSTLGATNDFSFFYFLLVVWFGSMFLLVLVLAVVADSYSDAADDNAADKHVIHLALNEVVTRIGFETATSSVGVIFTMFDEKQVVEEGEEPVMIEIPYYHYNNGFSSLLGSLFGVPARRNEFPNIVVQFARKFIEYPRKAGEDMANTYFTHFITGVILLNTVALAMEYPSMDDGLRDVLGVFNLIFTIVFMFELVVKMTALGFREYVNDAFNIFDAVVVAISVVELAMGGGGLSVLRLFRLLRVFKLAKSWKALNKFLQTCVDSLADLGWVFLVVIVFMCIFALMGMQLLGGTFDDLEEYPRTNYDDFYNALLAVFRINVGEFMEPLQNAIEAAGWGNTIFILGVLFVGQFLILNLFLALLLNNFAPVDDDDEEEEKAEDEKLTLDLHNPANKKELEDDIELAIVNSDGEEVADDVSYPSGRPDLEAQRAEKEENDNVVIIYSKSLMLLNEKNALRWHMKDLVEKKWFDYTILLCIVISSLLLAVEEPGLDENSGLADFLFICNVVFAIIFAIEAGVKIIAMGFIAHKHSYLRDPWNILDFFIVIIGLVSVILADVEIGFLKTIRVLRAFRPLRAIKRNEGMKIVITALFKSLPGVVNVLLVSGLFWLIFGIMGVQLFGDKYGSCDIDEGDIEDKAQCLDEGGEWVNAPANFDNIGNAFLTMMEMATFEGWYDIMYSGIDSRGENQTPREYANRWAVLYFVAFIVIGSFFILNLFIGVIVDSYNILSKKSKKGAFLTESQQKWVDATKRMVVAPKKMVPRPTTEWRGRFYDLVTDVKFEIFIMLVILANVGSMMLEHYEEEQAWTDAQEILNYIFTAIFIIEAGLKLVGLSWEYFRDAWNVFDFSIVIMSIFSIIIELIGSAVSFNPTIFRILRIARIARFFRIIKFAKGLQKLIMTLVYSLPSLVNIMTILVLIYFIFAILGMNLFGQAAWGENFNDAANFTNVFRATMVLFRLSTGAGWNELMNDLLFPEECDALDEGICQEGISENYPNCVCVNTYVVVFYFFAYLFVAFFVVVNMYLAVILDNFALASEEEEDPIYKLDLPRFAEVWAHMDPRAAGSIPVDKLGVLLRRLKPPLGLGRDATDGATFKLIRSLNLEVVGGRVLYADVQTALVRRHLGDADFDLGALPENIQARMNKGEEKKNKALNRIADVVEGGGTDVNSLEEEYAAVVIQKWFKAFMYRKEAVVRLAGIAEEAGIDLATEEGLLEAESIYAKKMKRGEIKPDSSVKTPAGSRRQSMVATQISDAPTREELREIAERVAKEKAERRAARKSRKQLSKNKKKESKILASTREPYTPDASPTVTDEGESAEPVDSAASSAETTSSDGGGADNDQPQSNVEL